MQSPDKKPVRYGMIIGLRPEQAGYYKSMHTAVWPDVLEKIKDCHIQNYSIYLQEIAGKLYLFSYMEYTGDDYEADMQRMAAHPATQRWWEEMHPCQLPLPNALAEGSVWKKMEEVFHLD